MFVIKHKPTGLFIGNDEDHIKIGDATQFDHKIEAQEHILWLANPDVEFEVVPNVNCPRTETSDV